MVQALQRRLRHWGGQLQSAGFTRALLVRFGADRQAAYEAEGWGRCTASRKGRTLCRALSLTLLLAVSAEAAPQHWSQFDRLVSQSERNMMANPSGALETARSAAAIAEQHKTSPRYTEGAATGLWLEAEALTRLNRIQEARAVLNRATVLTARDGKLTKLDGDVELTQGRIADNSGDVALALRSFQKAHAIFARLGNARSQSIALQGLGSIYYEAHDFGREVNYYRRASQVYSGDPVLLLSAANNIGFALQQIGRYDEANANFRRALRIAGSLKSPFLQGYILTNIAFVSAKQDRLAEAEQEANHALKLYSGSKESGWAPFVWGVKAEIDYRRRAYRAAASDLDRAFLGIDLRKTITPFRDIHEIAYKVYRATGNLPLALAHLEAFKRLDDEGRSLAASANLALTGAQFDFANQRLEIEHLRSEQLQRDISLRESRAALQRLLFLAALGAILILLAWIGWRHILLNRHRGAISQKNIKLLQTLSERDREIARRTEIEAQLRLAIETAQQASRAKSHFLANMSHELRTPLNAVIGFSELLMRRDMVPSKTAEYAGNIAEGGRHLLSIVNEILDMARIEAGKVSLSESIVVLEHIVPQTMSVIGCDKRTDRHVQFTCNSPGLALRADEVRLRQILINLLSNAVKFTDAGGNISVRVEDVADGIDIVVQDNGPGIPQDKLQIILEPFGQAESTYARAHGGAGLGLPIVKALTELHGGKFSIASELGKGTEARVHFPAERIVRRIPTDALRVAC